MVHAHDAHAVALAAAALALAGAGLDTRLVAARRVDFHLASNAFSRWKYRQVDCFICASAAIRALLETAGIPPRRTTVVGTLSSELRHLAYGGLSDHLATINHHTTLAARQLAAEQRRAGLADLAIHPPLVFLRNYLLRRGFRDGGPGLIISLMNACYVFLKFAKLWEQRQPADR